VLRCDGLPQSSAQQYRRHNLFQGGRSQEEDVVLPTEPKSYATEYESRRCLTLRLN
jgi:hypothetical protein